MSEQPVQLRNTTLVFLIKKTPASNIDRICLAMKKRGFGVNRWNGVGGKFDHSLDKTIEEAAIRETKEEIDVEVQDLSKVAELTFLFPGNPDWNQLVHVYLTEQWTGTPVESEEMRPDWFSPQELPFHSMWPDDPHWLPHVINGKFLKASFSFGKNDLILEKEITIVERL